MARGCTSGSNAYLLANDANFGTPVTWFPAALSIWFRPTNLSGIHNIAGWSASNSQANDQYRKLYTNGTTLYVSHKGYDNPTPINVSLGTITTGTWYHVFAYWVSNVSFGARLNGGTAVTGGFAKGLIPNKYFIVPDGETTRGMSFVFNGCDNWTSELKDDFDGDGTCNDFYIYWDDVPDVVGVKTIILSDVNVFPNPAGDFLNIASEFVSLKVYDIIGKEIMNVNTISRSSEYQLKTSSLQTGIYLIVVENFDGSRSMMKFSKK